MTVDALTLEHAQEAFTSCVITAVPHGTHRAQQRILFEEALVVAALELGYRDPSAGLLRILLGSARPPSRPPESLSVDPAGDASTSR